MTDETLVPGRDRYCIVGAGPSGLAMAAAFRSRGIVFDHFERHSAVGGLWDLANPGTPMYKSAHFISSRTRSGLPGYPMPDTFPDYPRRDQVLEYLRSYAAHHDLEGNIQFGTRVESAEPEGERVLVSFRPRGAADGPDGLVQRRYRGLVCASGINWEPRMPELAGSFDGELRHSVTYTSAEEFSGKRVLIVGLGNSGADIACDAVHSASQVWVSVRRGYHFIPKHIFGRPADVFSHQGPDLPLWLERPLFGLLQRWLVGDTERLGMPKPDHRVLESHPLLNDQLLHHLRHGDLQLCGEVAELDGRTVKLADGRDIEVDIILCATGYHHKIGYVAPRFVDPDKAGRAPLLTCFNPQYPSLFTLGFAELNGAVYPHVGRLAQLIAHVAEAQLRDPEKAETFFAWAQREDFDLSGGRGLINTARHTNYCDDSALRKATERAFRAMRW